MTRALESLVDEVRELIRYTEQQFVNLVLADFEDSLRGSQHPIRTAYDWLEMYQEERRERQNNRYADHTRRKRKRKRCHSHTQAINR